MKKQFVNTSEHNFKETKGGYYGAFALTQENIEQHNQQAIEYWGEASSMLNINRFLYSDDSAQDALGIFHYYYGEEFDYSESPSIGFRIVRNR